MYLSCGNVFVSDNSNLRIEKFTSGGIYKTQWSASLYGSTGGLAVDINGNVYVVNQGQHAILKFGP